MANLPARRVTKRTVQANSLGGLKPWSDLGKMTRLCIVCNFLGGGLPGLIITGRSYWVKASEGN